jgi:hypothetical protein
MKTNSKMTRRRLLKISGAGVLSVGVAGLITSCTGAIRSDFESMNNNENKEGRISSDVFEILKYASLAPSGHNMQPWFVKIKSQNEFIVGSDKERWLNAVDPENREAMLSIGAFIENLCSAASALGYESQVQVIAKNINESDIVSIKLKKSKTDGFDLKKISLRRTVKKGYLPKELESGDVKKITEIWPGYIFYFARNTDHSKCLMDWTIESYTYQSWRDDAQKELANCIRFTKDDAVKYGYGLTPEGMEIQGIAGWYVRNFMNSGDVMGKSFREQGIDMYSDTAKEGAGWIIITSKGSNLGDLIEAGRLFQRMALTVREMNIALHPMTQILEEKKWRDQMTAMHEPGVLPQFVLRVGYLKTYPNPVTIRRPVEWFVKS